MTFRETFITEVNSKSIGTLINDPSDSWMNESQRPYVNAMIKLKYIERIESDKIRKLQNIPKDMTWKKARELSKGITLPKRQNYSTWGKLIDKINNNDEEDIFIIKPEEISSKYTYCGYESMLTYVNWLKNLEYVEVIKIGSRRWIKIKKIKHIPDRLTVTLAQKMLYDNMYKRSIKIDKIKEQMNNI